MRTRSNWLRYAFACLASAAAASAWAQSPAAWPAKPVTVILPFPPGGSTELEFRVFSPHLAAALGQQFILDYKPGGGSTIGTAYVSKAKPDGYTLLCTSSSYSVVPAAYPDLPYDPINGLTPVSQLTAKLALLVVRPSLPIHNVAELIAYGKANPGKLNHATSGAGTNSHLRAERLYRSAGVEVTFIHYKGAGPVRGDLLAGRVDTAITNTVNILDSVKNGGVRAIASTGPGKMRERMAPDIPTVAEQGFPDFSAIGWSGIFAPPGTPPAIVDKLSTGLAKAAKDPEVVKFFQTAGTVAVGSTPAEFKALITDEVTFTKNIVKELGIKPEI